MKLYILIVMSLIGALAMAGSKKEHRHHEAHVHGAATLSLAFDQQKGSVEFRAASEGVLGFEHIARSDSDKAKLKETLAKFEGGITSMIKFDESLECVFTKEKVEMVPEKEDHESKDKHHQAHQGEHSDFVAVYSVSCKKEVKGTKLTIDFSQLKGLKDLDVTLLIGDLQKSVEIKGKPVTIDLK